MFEFSCRELADEPEPGAIPRFAFPAQTLLFHLPVPVARRWRKVVSARSSFQPFRSEAAIDAWGVGHGIEKGAVFTIQQFRGFGPS